MKNTSEKEATKTTTGLVFVSGVTGFIAGHIVKTLLEHGYNVRGSVRSRKSKNNQYLFDILTKINSIRSKQNLSNLNLELIECDLTSDHNWSDAVQDCQYVIHTANPMPDTRDAENKVPNSDDDFIKPAVEGMLRVMKACKNYGKSIKRVVYLSSIGAMNWELWDQMHKKPKVVLSTGTDWTPVDGRCHVPPYIKSKTLAEKTAWSFVEEHKHPFELVCVHPTLVIGPLLSGRLSDSMTSIKALLNGDYPFVPNLSFSIVDVRDVALAATLALTAKNANGNRYMLSSETVYFNDVGKLLEYKYGELGYAIPTVRSPTFIVDLVAKIDPLVRDFVAPICDVTRFVDVTPSKRDLGMTYLPVHQTLLDAAQSVIDNKIVAPSNIFKYYFIKYFSYVIIGVLLVIGYLFYRLLWCKN